MPPPAMGVAGAGDERQRLKSPPCPQQPLLLLPENRPPPEPEVEHPTDESKQPVKIRAAKRLRFINPSFCRGPRGRHWPLESRRARWSRPWRVVRAMQSCAIHPSPANGFVFLREYFPDADDSHRGNDDRA